MYELIREQDIKNHEHRKPKQHPDKLEKGAKMHWHKIEKSDQNLEKWSCLNIIDFPGKGAKAYMIFLNTETMTGKKLPPTLL